MKTPDLRDLEWQRRYQENDTPWNKEAAAPPLTSYLSQHPIQGRVLVPGCGYGHEVRALAAHDHCTAFGLDLAALAIYEAQKITSPVGTNSSAEFRLGNFFELSSDLQGSFDWIVEHTCFCAILPEQRADYVKAAHAALQLGGRLFAIFFMEPGREVGPPFGATKVELDGLFSPQFQLVDEWIPSQTFPDRQGQELVRILKRL